jgi:hypothetical protein
MQKTGIRCGGTLFLEMSNVRVAFAEYDSELTQDGKPKGYKFVSTHMVFDVKLGENYRRKARLPVVADGHKTDAPALPITYSSVVSRDSVRIALTIAALNIFVCDIQNAYLTAPCRERNIYSGGA